MSLNDAIEAIPRKTMVLFFMVDTSGSMSGSKIGALNAAIEEVIPELRTLSAANADAQIKIAALEFSSGSRWITSSGPVNVDDFRWQYLDAGGVTELGDACKKLNEKLSTKAFMQEATGSFAPALFLLSDGEPTDDFDGGLEELKKNNWYKKGIKVAVAIGDDADKQTLAKFTGGMESVLEVHSALMLRKMIRFVSVRASEVASKSVQAGAFGTAAAVVPKQTDSENPGTTNSPASPAQIPAGTAAAAAGAGPSIKQQALNTQLQTIAADASANASANAAANADDEW